MADWWTVLSESSMASVSIEELPVRKFAPEPTYRCAVCFDSGTQQLTSGSFDVGSDGRRTMVTATEQHPVGRRCKGPFAMECPYEKWRRQDWASSQPSRSRGEDAL